MASHPLVLGWVMTAGARVKKEWMLKANITDTNKGLRFKGMGPSLASVRLQKCWQLLLGASLQHANTSDKVAASRTKLLSRRNIQLIHRSVGCIMEGATWENIT